MRLLRNAALATLLLTLAATKVRAQCSLWEPGPLDNGTAPVGTDGAVKTMIVWDPTGSGMGGRLVIAGQFGHVQGVAANNIAVFDPGTQTWQPLGDGTDDIVTSLTVFNTKLVVAGYFKHAGGQPMNYAATWDGAVWEQMDNGGNPDGPSGPVNALALWNNSVVAAGSYHSPLFPSNILNFVQSWSSSATGWSTVSAAIPGCNAGTCGGTINCLTTWGTDLIAGGEFTLTNGVATQYTARFDGTNWNPMSTGMNNAVTCLQPWNGVLVAGGRFTQMGGSSTSLAHIASWNGTSWSPLGTGMNGDLLGLTVYNGALIAIGGFSTAGGGSAAEIAAWNGSFWSPLGSGLGGAFAAGFCGIPNGTELVVGGNFPLAGGNPANGLGRWDGTQWASYGGGVATAAYSMTNFLGRVVIGGDFHQSTPTLPAHDIVAWNGVAMSPFDSGMNGPVYSLKAFRYSGPFGNSELVAGGLFTTAGGVAATRIARWDQSSVIFQPPAWAAMGAGFNGAVLAIERYNNVTYAGGTFTMSGVGTAFIAKWNESTKAWEPVSLGMNGAVRALKVFNGSLYAGGDFTTAGGSSTGCLARWDGTSWSSVGIFFSSGTVNALEVYGSQLVIGGTYPGTIFSPNLIWTDGSSFGQFGGGGTDGKVRAITAVGSRLYVSGEFAHVGSVPARGVAYWDGAWHEAAGGVDDIVFASMGYHNELVAGGFFLHEQAGALASPRVARYSDGAPWLAQGPSSVTAPWGSNVSFTGTPASGFTGLTYQWFKDGVAIHDGAVDTGVIRSGTTTNMLSLAGITYADVGSYSVRVSNACGSDSSFGASLNLSGTTAVGPGGTGATVFAAISPNPSSGAVSLDFTLARSGRVELRVCDIAGRRLRRIDAGRLEAGPHRNAWDARTDAGEHLRPGIYFVTLVVDGNAQGMKRVTMIR